MARTQERPKGVDDVLLGETTITSRGQVTLPARGLRTLEWHTGDHLVVQRLAPDIVLLVRRPASWTESYAGRLTEVFGDDGDVLRYVHGERAAWDAEDAK